MIDGDNTQWAAIEIHSVAVAHIQTRRRCPRCQKGTRKRATHSLVSNDIVMASGCEWHIYQAWRGLLAGERE